MIRIHDEKLTRDLYSRELKPMVARLIYAERSIPIAETLQWSFDYEEIMN